MEDIEEFGCIPTPNPLPRSPEREYGRSSVTPCAGEQTVADLVRELSLSQGVVEKKTITPILSNVLIESANAGRAIVSGARRLRDRATSAADKFRVQSGVVLTPSRKEADEGVGRGPGGLSAVSPAPANCAERAIVKHRPPNKRLQ